MQSRLEAATRLFLRSRSRSLRVDAGSGTVSLSQLFKWSRKDFRSKPHAHELDFVAANLGAVEGAALQAVRARPGYKIKYLRYDWAQNIK
ncbi:MAG: hypothetical protein ABI333_14160 [bacterium]